MEILMECALIAETILGTLYADGWMVIAAV